MTKGRSKSVKKSLANLQNFLQIEDTDQMWLECFSWLEAMLLSRSFIQTEPVFQLVVICPAKPSSAGAFFEPTPTNRPTTVHQQQQPTNRLATDHQQPSHHPKSLYKIIGNGSKVAGMLQLAGI